MAQIVSLCPQGCFVFQSQQKLVIPRNSNLYSISIISQSVDKRIQTAVSFEIGSSTLLNPRNIGNSHFKNIVSSHHNKL